MAGRSLCDGVEVTACRLVLMTMGRWPSILERAGAVLMRRCRVLLGDSVGWQGDGIRGVIRRWNECHQADRRSALR